MREQYRQEMERLAPQQRALEQLCAMVEGETEMKRSGYLSIRAAAVLVCAALMVTAAAAAAVPAVWEGLANRLGVFAPYAQTVEGAACTGQGIKLQVLSALSDGLETQVYFSVADVEEDRLDQCLSLKGQLVTGTEKGSPGAPISAGDVGTGNFKLISYDPDTKTALFSAGIFYGDQAGPRQEARLTITEMSTRTGTGYRGISCASVTGETMETLPAGEGAEIIFRPSDVLGREHLDAAIPSQTVVLAPEQNPVPLEGTQDMWVSSMGFASDGCFHIRLGLAEGVRPEERGFFSVLGVGDETLETYQQTLVEGGMDILYPLLHPEDLELIRGCEARFYGPYARPGTVIEGVWAVNFSLEYHPSVTLDWSGELAGRQVRQVTLSPLSVTMHSDDPGGFHAATLYAVRRDGSTVAAEPDTGRYLNVSETGEPVWETFNTWKFEEPVDPEEVTALSLQGETIPVN